MLDIWAGYVLRQRHLNIPPQIEGWERLRLRWALWRAGA
jgi:hypothetical protein